MPDCPTRGGEAPTGAVDAMRNSTTGEWSDLCRPLAALVDRSPTAVIVVGPGGRVVYGNLASLDLFGVPAETLGQATYGDLVAGHGSPPDHFGLPDQPPPGRLGPVVVRHSSGAESEVTIDLIDLASDGSQLTGVILRDVETEHRTIRHLGATVEMLATAMSHADPAVVAERAVGLGRHVLDADICVLRHRNGSTFHQANACFDGSDATEEAVQHVCTVLDESASDRAIRLEGSNGSRHGDAPSASAVPVGEIVAAPIRHDGTTFGQLVVARIESKRPFPSHAEHTTAAFSSSVALAFDLWNTRDELDRQRWMVDHDRIARELHDTAIQRLFATAMRLEAAIPVSDDLAASRFHEAATEIDGVINDIRTAIFNLRRPSTSRGGLRAAIAAEVDGFAEVFGVVPRLHFNGVIDGSDLDEALTATMMAVVRELLANVSRHSSATKVDVSVSADRDSLRLSIADNGDGVPQHRVNGDGLANLSRRAEELGGHFEIGNHGDGAIAAFTVPIGTAPIGTTPSGSADDR